MKKKVIAALFVIFLALNLSGCWSRQELKQVAIILGTAIDLTEDNKIKLTYQIARPPAFGGAAGGAPGAGAQMNQNITWVVSATGETVSDAHQALTLQIPRRLYLGHNQILLLGEKVCRRGILDITNFFHRQPLSRGTIWVMATPQEAGKVLASHSELQLASAWSLLSLTYLKTWPGTKFRDLSMDLASWGSSPTLPRVELKRQGVAQGPGLEKPHTHEEAVFTGIAVFKDDKLAGWLNRQEAEGLRWLKAETGKMIVTVPSPLTPGKKDSFVIEKSKIKIDPVYEAGKIKFYIYLETETELISQQSTADIMLPKTVQALEKAVTSEIIRAVEITLEKVQKEYKTDIFGFGEAFHRKYKKAWPQFKKNWDDHFAEAQIYLAVKARITNAGMQGKRASIKTS